MKIKNDYVVIKKGKEEIKLKNMILDTYIKDIIANQMLTENRLNVGMGYVFLKFDTELDFEENTILGYENFDLTAGLIYNDIEYSKKEIINNYTYSFSGETNVLKIPTYKVITSFEEYNGRKITAIGFNWFHGGNMYACLDVRNYNIYFDASQPLVINRRDILSTDAYFYSESNFIQEPIHLCSGKSKYYAILKSVGLGHNPFSMIEEHTLLPYDEHIQISGNSIAIDDELTIEKKSEGLFPKKELYPAADLYPARIITEGLYPAEDIYPGVDVYPAHSAYQYVQLKYEIYKTQSSTDDIDTGEYYLLSMLIGNKEKIKLNILYERA